MCMRMLLSVKERIRVAYVYRSIPQFPIFLVFFLFIILGAVEGTYFFLVLGLFNISEVTTASQTIALTVFLSSVQFFLSGPAAWLGQKYGRWKLVFVGWNMVFFSLCTMCILGAITLFSLNSTDRHLDRIEDAAMDVYFKREGRFLSIVFCMCLPLYFGLSCIWTNLLTHGIDILNQSPPSGEQISSYFHWAFWSISFGYFLSLGVTFLFSVHHVMLVLSLVAIPIWLGLLLLLHPRLKNVATPSDGNTLHQVWSVLAFVSKKGFRRWKQRHNSLVEMSGTTVRQWRAPESPFDYAKDEFQGPFESDYVDDVRKFIHILLLLVALFGYYTVYVLMATTYLYQTEGTQFPQLMISQSDCDSFLNRTSGLLTTIHYYQTVPAPLMALASYGTTLLGVAVLDLLVYPCLGSYSPSIIVRIGIGLFFAAISSVYALAAEVVRYSQPNPISKEDYTKQFCNVFQPLYDGPKDWYCDYEVSKFYAVDFIPQFVFLGLAQCFVSIGAFEHVCGSSPVHMRGLLTGLLFTVRGLGYLVAALAVLSQADTSHPMNWCYFCGVPGPTHTPNCIIAYFLLLLLMLICGGLYLWVYGSQHLKYSDDSEHAYVNKLRQAFVYTSKI